MFTKSSHQTNFQTTSRHNCEKSRYLLKKRNNYLTKQKNIDNSFKLCGLKTLDDGCIHLFTQAVDPGGKNQIKSNFQG